MNRRGFLSLLSAALAEPLIPKGTAFSFLGGIYRPAWTEVPTAWPIPLITLTEGMTLTIEGSTQFMVPGSSGEIKAWRSPFAPKDRVGEIIGLAPYMDKPILLKDRDGNLIIRETGNPLKKAPLPPIADSLYDVDPWVGVSDRIHI